MRKKWLKSTKKALSFVLALSILLTSSPALFGAIAAQTDFDIKKEDAPVHHKTIVDNGDGTFDINLDVHGYESKKVNVAMVVDVSSSMQKSISGQEATSREEILFSSVDSFVNQLYGGQVTDEIEVNISVVAFQGTARILQTWTNSKEEVLAAVAEAKYIATTTIGNILGSGTNPQSGLTLANVLYRQDEVTAQDMNSNETVTISTNRPANMDTAENYVLLFSDGGPNRCYVNRDQIAITTPDENKLTYVENGNLLALTEIVYVDGVKSALYNGGTYPIVTETFTNDDGSTSDKTGFRDADGAWHDFQTLDSFNNSKHNIGVNYPGTDGYASEEEFYNDYSSYGSENLTGAVLSSAPVLANNGKIQTPDWTYNDDNVYNAVNIIAPQSTDYRKIAAQAALVEAEDIYEYAQSRNIAIDVMSFGVGGWFTATEKESKFPTAQRFLDLVSAVGNGTLTAYEAEEAYLLDEVISNQMPAASGEVNIADYTKVYTSSNTADAYRITDRNYTKWVADASTTAEVADWAYLDLGGLYAIGTMTVNWAYAPGDFVIKTAVVNPADSSTWAEGGDVTTSSNWTEIGSYNRTSTGAQDITFTAHAARYVMVYSASRSAGNDTDGYNFGINRINIFRGNANANYNANENRVAGLTAMAPWNAAVDYTASDETTTLVTDGDLNTVFSMKETDTASVRDGMAIDLLKARNINKVVIHWQYAPISFVIETSYGDYASSAGYEQRANVITSDIMVYDSVDNASDTLTGTTTIQFNTVKARYIGIKSENRNLINGKANWAIKEIEVYATQNEDAFSLPPAYNIYGHGIAPIDSVTADASGNMISAPYYYINDAYDENRIYTAEARTLNSDVSFDVAKVSANVEKSSFGGDSEERFIEQFKRMTGAVLEGFARVRIYDTFSKYVTLAHEMDGWQEKAGIKNMDTATTTWTDPVWLTVKSYTSTNNEDGKNTSDNSADYKLDEVQISKDNYTTYYYKTDDPNGGNMATEAIELRFADEYVLDNQSMVRLTVTVKPTQYAIDTYFKNITSEDYIAPSASVDSLTGYSAADANGIVTDGGIDPAASVYDRRHTGGYPDQAFNVIFGEDAATGYTLYNSANPNYAGDSSFISAEIARRQYVEGAYGFHTNVLSATNIEYYITAIGAINAAHENNIMAASYDMPVIQVDLLDIPVRKVWNDGDVDHMQDSIFATISWEQNVWETAYDDKGVASVFKTGTEAKSITVELNEDNSWSGVFENVPQGYTYSVTETYKDGTPVGSYSVSMDKTYNVSSDDVSVNGHTFSINDTTITDAELGDGLIITNTHTVNKTVTKVWEGDDETVRPMNITIRLMADGEAYGEDVILNAANNWSHTWVDIPEYNKNGTKIDYYVAEVSKNEYVSDEVVTVQITDRDADWQYYTSETNDVDADWNTEGYVPANTAWATGKAPFSNWAGDKRTTWSADGYLWARKTFNIADITALEGYTFYFELSYDQPFVVYINGQEAFSVGDAFSDKGVRTMTAEQMALLKTGVNTIAFVADNSVDANAADGTLANAHIYAQKRVTVPASQDYQIKTVSSTELIPAGSDWLYYSSASDDAVSNWAHAEFDSIGWPTASAPFGNTEGFATEVNDDYLWLRKSFTVATNDELNTLKNSQLYLRAELNEFAEIYINGRHVHTHLDATGGATFIPLGNDASELLVLGEANAIGIKLVNANGDTEGVYLDASLIAITDTSDGLNATFTNVHGSEVKEFSVVSTWDDQNNVDGLRPDYVTVQLYKDGVATGDTVVLCPDNSWSYTWTDLEVGAEYTVIQSTVDGYTTTYDYSTTNLAIIKNVHVPEKVDKTVYKIWNDNSDQDALRPEEIKLQLYANGKEYGNAVIISGSGDNWSYTWADLPKYESGREIIWSVQELEVPYGYAATYSDDRWTITNNHTAGITKRTVTKVWEDNNSASRPTEVTVQLYANAAPLNSIDQALVSTSSMWYTITSHEELYHDGWNEVGFGNLGYGEYMAPLGNDGTENSSWTYADINLDGVDDNYYLYMRKEFSIESQASLDEIKGADAVLRVLSGQNSIIYLNGQEIYSTAEATNGYVDIALDDTVKNILQVGGNCIAIECNNGGADLPDTRIIDAGIYYHRDFTVTLNEANDWTYTWDSLPLKENGLAIKYAVYETNVPEGYSVSYSTDKNDTSKINVINTLTRDITVIKTWVDNDNAAGIRPSSIDVQLFANGALYGEAVTVTAENNYTYTWTDVPYYADGEEIIFSVEEVVPNGYTPYYGGSDGNLTIQNYTNENLVDYSVKKTWDDMENVNKLRPETIFVQLYQGYNNSFTAYGRPVKLSASNGWTYSWTDLLGQVIEGDTTYNISYYARELEVPDSYTVAYSDNAGNTEIVNTMHIQSLILQKQDGFNPEVFLPGAEFKIELMAADKKTVDTNFPAKTAVTDNEGLLVFENLTVGYYKITETKAPEGYDIVEPFYIDVKLAAQNVAAEKNAYVLNAEAVTVANEAITDGDSATYWTSSAMDSSYYIDLGVDRAINKIDVRIENAPLNMTFEYLAGGQDADDPDAEWRTIGTYAAYNGNGIKGNLINDTSWNSDAATYGMGNMVVEFDTVVARYVRISGDAAPINPFDNTDTKYKTYKIYETEIFLDKTYEYAQDGFAYTSSVFTETDHADDPFQYTYMDMASNVGDSLDHRDDSNNDDGMYYSLKESDYIYSDIDPETEGYQHPDEWIAVDLLENTTIDKLKIEWENASGNFRLIYLADGCAEGDWLDLSKYTVYTGSSRSAIVDDSGNEATMVTHEAGEYSFTIADVNITDSFWYMGETIIYLDEAINARYIGIVSTERLCTENAFRGNFYAIREIDMYNTASADPTFDYALAKSAFAYNINQREEFLGTSAIDRSASNYLETAWISDFDVEEQMSFVTDATTGNSMYEKSYRVNDYKEWINVKLDGTVGINHIVLEWADSNMEQDWGEGTPLPWDQNKTTVTLTYPEEYYILYSLDGSYWTEFYHVTDGDGGRDEYTFSEIEAKYIRVYIPDGSRNAGVGSAYALYSLELYSTADQYVAVLDTPQTKNSEVVIDYGLPVQVNVMADQLASVQNKATLAGIGAYDSSLEYNTKVYDTGITGTEVVGKYGILTVVNGKLRYTPTTMCFEDEDIFTYCLATPDGEYKYSTLTVMPATTVQYEEDFTTITYSDGAHVEEPVNLASGKLGYSATEQGTENMTDGNTSTNHNSYNNVQNYEVGTPEFFVVDLGANTKVNKLYIDWENCATEFYVAYLADGGDVTDIASYTKLDTKYTVDNVVNPNAAWGTGTTTIELTEAVNARYVGVYVTDRYEGTNNKKRYLKVREMEIYNTLGEDVVNLASGKYGYSTAQQGYNMTDGSESTKLYSGVTFSSGTPEFFAVDLGKNTSVTRLNIKWENCAGTFYVAYLGDGGDPTKAASYSTLPKKYTSNDITLTDINYGVGNIEIDLGTTINARYVGVYVTDRYVSMLNNRAYLSVRELEVYNDNVGTHGMWELAGDATSGHNKIQDTDRPGKGNADDADNAYGFDSAYDASAQFGLGKARKVTVSAANNPYLNPDAAWPTATFTFTGTGFDIIALTSNTTGTIWVDVYKGTTTSGAMYRSWLVDTYYGYSYDAENDKWGVNPDALSSLYQIPVINGKDFDYGTYTVVVTASYSKGFDHTDGDGYQYDFYFDGVRVYNPAGSNDTELGRTIVNAYIADNEYNPNVTEIKTNLVDLGDLTANGQAAGATFVDGRSSFDTTTPEELAAAMDAFKNCGPNNEIYLAYGQGVAFNIYSAYEPTGVQIGFKSITGDEVEATVKFGMFHIMNKTMSSSTTRFYDASVFVGWGGNAPVDFKYDEATGMYKSTSAIIISNTMNNSGILSVTNIKLTYADTAGVASYDVLEGASYSLAGHTQTNAKINAYIASSFETVEDGYQAVREQVLADKYNFVPTNLRVQWNENSAKQGEKVTLTVTTSTDVKSLTANGTKATVKYYNADGDEKSSEVGAKKAVWTVLLDVSYAGEYLAQIEAMSEDGRIYKTSATIYSAEY